MSRKSVVGRAKKNNETIICDHCGEEYPRLNFRNHRRIHPRSTQEMKEPLPCPVCKKMIDGRRFLVAHMKKHPEKVPLAEVVDSDSEHSAAATIEEHNDVVAAPKKAPVEHQVVRTIRVAGWHTQPKKQCPECLVTFRDQSILDQHLMIHVNQTIYHCDKCGRLFTNQLELIVHDH